VSTIGWYYLHENGDLIYKAYSDACADIRDSSFARALWPMNPKDREGAWTIVVEGLAAGARADRVRELADKWCLTDGDAEVYAQRIGVRLFRDGAAWCATREDHVNLQESPTGFGDRAYEALAALAKELGYEPSLMWGNSFAMLAKATRSAA
jgi:hypothetical protein